MQLLGMLDQHYRLLFSLFMEGLVVADILHVCLGQLLDLADPSLAPADPFIHLGMLDAMPSVLAESLPEPCGQLRRLHAMCCVAVLLVLV